VISQWSMVNGEPVRWGDSAVGGFPDSLTGISVALASLRASPEGSKTYLLWTLDF